MQSVAASFTQSLPASPVDGFAPGVATLAAPEGIQLLSISVLLLIFAVAAISADNEQGNQTEGKEKSDSSQVQLVRPDACAFRSGVVTGIIGLLKILPSSPREGFAPSVTSMESLEGLQFLTVSLLLLVFAMAVKSEREAETETTDKSMVELVSVDAIAFRSAILAGLIGMVKTFGGSAARAEVLCLCRQNFDLSAVILETSEGLQLLSVSILLLVFALAVREDAGEQKEESESKVELVRTDVIAFNFAAAAAIIGSLKVLVVPLWIGLAQILPASPQQGFAPISVAIEAPEAIQVLSISALLLVFAVAVACEDEGESKSQVELVRSDAIAFRSAMVAAFIGMIKAMPPSPPEGFAPTVATVEAPEGFQFLCISLLLLVFALAVNSDKVTSKEDENATKEKSKVELVRVDAIAFRTAVLAGFIGVLKTFANAQARAELASMSQKEFSPSVAMLEAPEGVQVLIISILLFIFTAAINSKDDVNEKVNDDTKGNIQLIRPQTIAFRSAVVAGLMGLLMTIDNGLITLPRFAITGEVSLVLGTGFAVILSDVPRHALQWKAQ